MQKKPNVSVSSAQNAVLCSNYLSVQHGKNTVITVSDSIKAGQMLLSKYPILCRRANIFWQITSEIVSS